MRSLLDRGVLPLTILAVIGIISAAVKKPGGSAGLIGFFTFGVLFCGFHLYQGLTLGKFVSRYGEIRRDEHPHKFWSCVLFIIAGFIFIGSYLAVLLWKPE